MNGHLENELLIKLQLGGYGLSWDLILGFLIIWITINSMIAFLETMESYPWSELSCLTAISSTNNRKWANRQKQKWNSDQ